jgi:hypothetical protein
MNNLEDVIDDNMIRKLIKEREEYRFNKNWEAADKILAYLCKNNIIIIDDKNGQSSYKYKDSVNINSQDVIPNKHDKKGRHSKVKNQKRKKTKKRGEVFSKWLLANFNSILNEDCSGVLDIAGGKGVVSYHLCRSKIKCTVIDPMPLKLSSNKTKEVMSNIFDEYKFDAEHCQNEKPVTEIDNLFMTEVNDDIRLSWLEPETLKEKLENFKNLQDAKKFFNNVKNNLNNLNLNHQRIFFTQDCNICHTLVKESSFLIGFHPDQATEDIVNFSLKYNKSFAIVPCCVFPSLFPNRKGADGKPVRTFEQFLDYLQNKNPKIKREVILDLSPPNNICLYYLSNNIEY